MEAIRQYDNWYALFVLTGQEEKVRQRLNYRFSNEFNLLVPKRHLRERKNGVWRNILRTVFPGYVLVNGEIDPHQYYRMMDVPGILKLLKSEWDFLKVDSKEMEDLSRLLCSDEVIGFSRLFIKDGKVTVVEGPLKSFEGKIADINHRKGRAKVMVNFMGEPRVVELGVSMLEPN
jgi:transcription termination/antitermination protein NusG